MKHSTQDSSHTFYNAGFKIRKASELSLLRMINNKSIDMYPLPFISAYRLQLNNMDNMKNIIVDKNIFLCDNSNVLFFVHKDNADLFNALNTGFKNAYQDGSFMHLFESHPDVIIATKKLGFNSRTLINIEGQNKTTETKSIPLNYLSTKIMPRE